MVLDPTATVKTVILNFLADGGDGYGSGVTIGAGERVDLVLDGAVPTSVDMSAQDPGLASFANTGSEQDALAEYLQEFHPDPASAYAEPDTIADLSATDTRITTL